MVENSENNKFEHIVEFSYSELKKIKTADKINDFEKQYLKGNSSYLSKLLSQLKNCNNKEDKKVKGQKINDWKKRLTELVKELKKNINFESGRKNNNCKLTNAKKNSNSQNFTSSGKLKVGSFHLIEKSLSEIYSFFISLGYKVFESREIETKWYNFDSLNLESDHPARSWSDTFYFSKDSNILLRTHTSSSQMRVMQDNKNEEIMVISGGKVYRNDDDDPTHSHQYTNIEILRINKEVSFANLKWVIERFFQWFFERKVETRFRPSFFPFTEPSFEVDISCFFCRNNSEQCKLCKNTKWIEVLGAGLVNPAVLKNSGYDEKKFSGFAAGIGLERILMIKYGVEDIRDFYLNDPRFLNQVDWS